MIKAAIQQASANVESPLVTIEPVKILLVDDQPENLLSASAVLESLGQEVIRAESGREALRQLLDNDFAVIVLDVMMPEMDGFETAALIRQRERSRLTPIIFLTALGRSDDHMLRGYNLGAVDYMTKPASAPLVRARVRTHIELKRQRDLLEQRALVDQLTGIANRRRFDEALEQRWRHAARDNTPLLLVLIDVDLFKQYNDHYGHAAGDDCLKRIAGVLQTTFAQAGELAARIGGEEFALLLPGGNVPARMRQLLHGVHELQLAHACSSAGAWVSVSAGAIETVPKPDASSRPLLEAADQLLYQAKRNGRARCVYSALEDGLPRTVALERG